MYLKKKIPILFTGINNDFMKLYLGFPTMLYFENGVQQYPYPGDNNKAAMISFLKDPKPEVAKKAPEKEWKDEPSEVAHLTGS